MNKPDCCNTLKPGLVFDQGQHKINLIQVCVVFILSVINIAAMKRVRPWPIPFTSIV